MSPSPAPTPLKRRVTTWGPLVVALLLGTALVASAAESYRSAVASSEAVTLEEGRNIFDAVQFDLSSSGEALREALASEVKRSGAAYLAMWENGRLLAAAGHTEFPDLGPTPLQLQLGPTHARMCLPGFRAVGSPEVALAAPAWSIPLRLPADRALGLEFVPSRGPSLGRRALAGVGLSLSAAVLLMSAAVVFWNVERRAACMRAVLARQEQLARLGTMSAVLAHEIRNPLASLKGNAQLLAEDPSGPKAESRIRRVVADAVRLEALTNDLLAFVRSGAVEASPASPAKVLEAAAMNVDAARIDVSADRAPDSWSLDARRLEQVLVNLLDNALRVTPAGEKVSATVARAGPELVYTVRDRGPGVEPAERARIFEPFHTTRTRGTGLGLAIARRIVELHGGRIDVDDAPGGGAIFQVRIP